MDKRKLMTVPVLLALSGLMLTSCGVVDKVDEMLGFEETTKKTTQGTIATAPRNRETTTTRIYTVGEEKEYTTTTARDDAVDPDELERASVTAYEKKKKGDYTLNTTTTTRKSDYSVLQKPDGKEYFEITKSYLTKERTELRYGPSKQFDSQAILKSGEQLLCMGQSGNWYYVLYDNTTYGWVDSSAVEDFSKKTTTKKK